MIMMMMMMMMMMLRRGLQNLNHYHFVDGEEWCQYSINNYNNDDNDDSYSDNDK